MATPIVPTQHYVTATGVITATPDKVFEKLEGIIAQRFPDKVFRIIAANTLTYNNEKNWTVAAVIEEIR